MTEIPSKNKNDGANLLTSWRVPRQTGSKGAQTPAGAAGMPKGGGKRTSDIEVDENDDQAAAPTGADLDGASALPRDFKSLMLRDEVVRGLEQAGYERPSPVQARAIPLGKFGADLIIQAKSGTGKTCVFAVIVLESILLDFRAPQAIIIAPTRELAHQTRDVIRTIGQYMEGLGCQAFVGGMSTDLDVKALSAETSACHVVSGTPGRLRALIEIGALRLEGVRHLVLDEVDQLLAEGFRQQVEYFLAVLPTRRQMLAVSATFTKELLDYLGTIMHKPSMVSVVKDSVALKGVRQFFLDVLPDAGTAGDTRGGSRPGTNGAGAGGASLQGRDKLKSRMHGLGDDTPPVHAAPRHASSSRAVHRLRVALVVSLPVLVWSPSIATHPT